MKMLTCLLLLATLSVASSASAQGPPSIDLCEVDVGNNEVNLGWTNHDSYFLIDIQVENVTVASLPGTATSYTITGFAPGNYVICVAGIDAAGAVVQPLHCCDAFFPIPGPIPDLLCEDDPSATGGGVLLSWPNGGFYTAIEVLDNGVVIDTISGTSTSYLLTGLAPGTHTLCVLPYAGAMQIVPAACCQYTVGAVSPITAFLCDVIPGTNNIQLNWTTTGPIAAIQIYLDGVVVATLPAADTSYLLIGVGPGTHTACARALNVLGAPIPPDACCLFTIGGGPVPIDPLFCDQSAAGPNDIFLFWTNGSLYDAIDVSLDGVLVATLPGTATSFLLSGLTPGGHTVCVRAFFAGAAVIPDACCDFVVGGVAGPIDSLNCFVIAGSTNDVQLNWTNGGAYTSILLVVDGVLAATLPGSATSFVLTGVTPGSHTACLRALVGTTPISPDACCTFAVGTPIPIDPLFCSPLATGAPNDLFLSWTNNGAYTAIEVYLDGAVVANLPGTATSHLITGVAPGSHEACVLAYAGAAPLLPEACCQFDIDAVDPIAAVQCGPVAGALGISVTWTNSGAYTSIEIELDGAVVATLPGTATSYLLSPAGPGTHTVCVIPYSGPSMIVPVPCCTFTVAQEFRRGDSNVDALYNIADAVFLLTFLFSNGPAPLCDDSGDANDDGQLNIGDAVYLLGSLFSNGPLPPAPHPACGSDPTADPLGCASFPPCP